MLSWELAATSCRRLSSLRLGWELEISIIPGLMADWGLQGGWSCHSESCAAGDLFVTAGSGGCEQSLSPTSVRPHLVG